MFIFQFELSLVIDNQLWIDWTGWPNIKITIISKGVYEFSQIKIKSFF